MSSHLRSGRTCSRVSCTSVASMTLTYIYSESTAVLGPLATFSEPHSYDLCAIHGNRLTVPNGWSVIKEESSQDPTGPSDDDLMAIADAVREVAMVQISNNEEILDSSGNSANQLGRRGHLRAVPS